VLDFKVGKRVHKFVFSFLDGSSIYGESLTVSGRCRQIIEHLTNTLLKLTLRFLGNSVTDRVALGRQQ